MLVLKVTENWEGRDVSPQLWQTPPSLGHQQGRREQDGDIIQFIQGLVEQRWAAGFPSLKRTVDHRKAWIDGYFLASSPTPCRQGAAPNKRLNYQLPHATDWAGSLVQDASIYKATAATIPLNKKKNTQKALQEISENKCWWSAFLKQSQWFHIWNLIGCNPDWSWGISSALLRKAEENGAPLSPAEIQSVILPTVFLKYSWIYFKEQGWMEPRWYWTVSIHIWQYLLYIYVYMYTYIYTIYVQLQGRIFLLHMASLRNSWKSCPPDHPLSVPLTRKCSHLWPSRAPKSFMIQSFQCFLAPCRFRVWGRSHVSKKMAKLLHKPPIKPGFS